MFSLRPRPSPASASPQPPAALRCISISYACQYQLGSSGCASRAAWLLGVPVEELARAVFVQSAPAASPASASPQPPAAARCTSYACQYQLGSSGCASRAAWLLGVPVKELARAVFVQPAPAASPASASPQPPAAARCTSYACQYQLGSRGCASRAARLLGVPVEELARAVFVQPAPAASPVSASPQPPAALRCTSYACQYQLGSSGCASRAAWLLDVPVEELARAVFVQPAPAASPASSPQPPAALRTPSPSSEREVPGSEALDAFVTGLYNETFNIVAALINRSLSTSARTSASILLLDTPGADNPMCSGQQSGAPLSKLLSNYLQERLQAVFHDALLVAPRERYAQEGITLDDGSEEDWLSETVNPGPMVELLDKSPQNSIVRSSQADLRDCDRRGLLWLLDEESMYPGSSDDSFLERVLSHYGPPQHTQYLIKKAPHARQFVLQHLQGTNPVLYDVTGWVKASRENPVTKKAHTLLQESQNEDVGRLSCWARGACGVGAWSAAVGDASTLRRASSIRRTLTSGTAGMKRRSTALQAKFVADGVVDTLRRCGSGGVQFVCCLLTNQPSDMADDVNVPLLRSQFRGFQLLDAARLYKQGFPEHMPLSEFARRYRLLATSESETPENTQQTATLSDRQIVDDMLLALDLDVTSYRLGLTQIYKGPLRSRLIAGAETHRCGVPDIQIERFNTIEEVSSIVINSATSNTMSKDESNILHDEND
ncbi:unnamed protein product [Parnassius apollo]|uniref:(apollo) hypothetical protein n=1 Tax=Parnassius apollo TaxID=110799 RepID=A0A8S3Y594_PARAO|nr:unnamed protein product [Parnassius apollo]